MENDQDLTGDKIDAADQGGDQKTVPLAALENERGKRQSLEEKVRTLEENIALYRANVSGPDARRESEPAKEKDLLDGMDEDDVMTVGEMKKILKKQTDNLNKEKEEFGQRIGSSISEVQIMITNPDYKDVISKNLPNVLKAKPALAAAIKSSQNPYLLAYELGKLDPAYKAKESGDQIDKNAQKIIDNLGKPQLGKGGGGGGLDKIDQYAKLSDDQLEERISQVKNK